MWTREGGGGVPEKTMFVHIGGREGLRLVHVDKNVLRRPVFAHESKKGCENFKKKLYMYVNELLVCPFEQLYNEFL